MASRLKLVGSSVVAFIVLASFQRAALAVDGYAVSPLSETGVLSRSKAFGLNNYGQVVGWSEDESGNRHATHWLNSEQTDLAGTTHLELLLDFNVGIHEGFAISDADQIAGTGQVKWDCPGRTIFVYRAMLLRAAVLSDLGTPLPGDAVTDLGTLGHPCSAYNSAATAISNANHVVGWADVDDAATIRAVLVRPTGNVWYADADADLVNDNMVDLGTLGGAESSASGVNDNGVVTGYSYLAANAPPAAYHAFRLTPQGNTWYIDADNDGDNDLMESLGTLGGRNSWGRAINNNGDIVGESDRADYTTRAFLNRAGSMLDLGTLGGKNSSAADINDLGQVVGWAEDAQGRRRAFIWENGVMTDLNNVLIFGQSTDGITFTEARSINNNGQIAGFGTIGSGDSVETRAFLISRATPQQLAEAEAAEAAAAAVVAGVTTGSGGSGGGSAGAAGGTPIVGTPSLVGGSGSSGSDEDDEAAGELSPTLAPLCGVGIVGFAPLMLAGLALGKRRL